MNFDSAAGGKFVVLQCIFKAKWRDFGPPQAALFAVYSIFSRQNACIFCRRIFFAVLQCNPPPPHTSYVISNVIPPNIWTSLNKGGGSTSLLFRVENPPHVENPPLVKSSVDLINGGFRGIFLRRSKTPPLISKSIGGFRHEIRVIDSTRRISPPKSGREHITTIRVPAYHRWTRFT